MPQKKEKIVLACRNCYSPKIDEDGCCLVCKRKRYVVPIDEDCSGGIKALWKSHVFTENCCSGHEDQILFKAYVLFSASYPLCEFLKTKKTEYEKKFYPIQVGIGERGLAQFMLKEPRSGMFSKAKRAEMPAIFNAALQQLATDYQKMLDEKQI